MVERITLQTETLEFAALAVGDGDSYALLFHGFPDDASSMVPLLDRLADAGYRAVAPYMRGYGETEQPPLMPENYAISRLGSDVLAVANALGAQNPLVVGHDWGAIAITAVSRLIPEFATACVPIAVPPDFARGLQTNPVQALRSWYMSFFQIPGLAADILRRDDFALIERLWQLWSPGWNYSPDRLAAVKETFRTGETVAASLQYYRAMYQELLSGHVGSSTVSGIETPTLLLGGADDGCIGPELFSDSADCYEGPHETRMLDRAGHFCHNERPDEVTDLILEFVREVDE